MNFPVSFRIILLPPYLRSPFLVPFCFQSKMFEAWVGMKGLHTLQRHRILMILKVMWYGQERHRFKSVPRFDKGEMVFLPLSIKIRSRYWSH